MVRRILGTSRRIPWVLWVALLLTGAAAYAQPAKRTITVGPNVQVSATNDRQDHYEVWVAADPKNPKDLIGCSMIEPKMPAMERTDTIVYSSFDGGASWAPTLESDAGRWQSADPACVFGNDGRAYFASLAMETASFFSTQNTNHMLVYRSTDEGKTWSEPAKLPMVDREYISVDTTDSKYHGSVYIVAHGAARAIGQGANIVGLAYFRSGDFGKTFSDSYLMVPPPNHWILPLAQSAILSDGTIVVFFSQTLEAGADLPLAPRKPTLDFDVVRSTNGGLSFSPATVAVQAFVGNGNRSAARTPTLAVDQTDGPFKDQLYSVWTDYRDGRSEILMIHSSDKGKTWSKPIVVNDDKSWGPGKGPDDFMPTVAVNRNGVVGVMWYDRRDNPDDLGYYVRFAASLDGGETFLPSVRVSAAPQTYAPKTWRILWPSPTGGGDPTGTSGGDLRGGFVVNTWPGHTAGLAAGADGVFHPFWVDNRTGVQQIWTAAVKVNGDAVPNGSAELANWKDVTSEVFLEFGEPIFDASRQTLSVDAYLVNTSHEPIRGPLELRFLALKSNFDAVDATNADNDVSGPGALFKFADQLPGEVLKPGQRSLVKQLVFRITGFHDLRGSTIDNDPPVLFNYDARVLAPPGQAPAAPIVGAAQ